MNILNKKLVFALDVLKLLRQIKEIKTIIVIILKFVISVRVGHCYCSSRASVNISRWIEGSFFPCRG
jgi:hypothetical protein